MKCREYNEKDYKFLREMLYEAIFWSKNEKDKPTLEEGLSYDYSKHILVDFGKRDGDLAVICENDCKRIGAAFIRHFNPEVNMRGYISDEIPVLVIAVAKEYRKKGAASSMLKALKELAVKNNVHKISLCVTKGNIAYGLYSKQGFEIYEDIEDSYNMLWKYED